MAATTTEDSTIQLDGTDPPADDASGDAAKAKDYLLAKRALTAVNFFVETNRLEPYAAVYLVDKMGWPKVDFGIVSLVMNVAMVVFQTPAGDLLDKTKRGKKIITTAAILVAAFTTVMVVWTSNFWAILFGKTVEGICSTIFLPALMSLLLGISRNEEEIPRFIATTEVSNKIGSFIIVVTCAAISYYTYPDVESMFYLLGAGGLAAAFFTFLIPESAIDHDKARQLDDSGSATDTDELDLEESPEEAPEEAEGKTKASPSRYRDLFKNRSIVLFAVLTFTYHLANAGPAPLLAQYVASITPDDTSLTWTSAIMILWFLPQAATSFLMTYAIDRFDHKRIMTVAFVTVPVRCAAIALLVEFSNSPWALVSTQTLEGIGAGVYDVMIPIVVQKMTKGSGRFGFADRLSEPSSVRAVLQFRSGALARQGGEGDRGQENTVGDLVIEGFRANAVRVLIEQGFDEVQFVVEKFRANAVRVLDQGIDKEQFIVEEFRADAVQLILWPKLHRNPGMGPSALAWNRQIPLVSSFWRGNLEKNTPKPVEFITGGNTGVGIQTLKNRDAGIGGD
ncbi:major facilitator superfamily transporter [Thalassiosira oceanica]|uniref:Major facilitator superfamily transporter n=1 Tax=Thalassiosira oceanica TaxID=159749 RepID=K0R667_THAOC|nr:major facilitator superfamily transporter [Thalassiosira oceanica]|eukprot:EJK47434.1 major facilitator superfamily transporter [Thalassiosira oceanica]